MTMLKYIRLQTQDAGDRPPFAHRPLSITDADQAACMAAMNGPYAYCPNCFETGSIPDEIGLLCPNCRRGAIIPGEEMLRLKGWRTCNHWWIENGGSENTKALHGARRYVAAV